MSKLASEIISQKQHSFDNLSTKRQLWDRAEELFHNQLNDLTSIEAESQVFDPKLSTLTIERAYRVMAQLGVGKVKGISSNDMGDAKLKNLLLDKYVIPNANAQFDFLTKLRMVDMYSNIYGNFFVLIDHDVKSNGYVGPDMWLLNIRDVFPQPGAVSLEDSEYITIRTWKSYSYFEGLKGNKDFKNITAILNKLKKMSGDKHGRDGDNVSKREQDQYPNNTSGNTDNRPGGYFEVLTRFEKGKEGHWVDVCVDADLEFRDQANPHEDGELPVVCKHSIPLLDDFMGMGDFERGGSMQMVVNANWNLYLDAVKMSIFPPMLINKDNVASLSSFKPIPGAMWLGRGQINNIAQAVNLSPQGISTFNNVHQVAVASLQGLFGSSDTSVSATVDPTMGKTPEALKMQGQRENTRDNADRFYMEQFITAVMKKMVNLMCKKQNGSLTIRMFPEEMEQLEREYPEMKESYDENKGELTVKKGKDMLYDYEIVSGSTYAIDKDSQREFLMSLFETYMKAQQPDGNNTLDVMLKRENYDFKFGELMKRIVSSGGIQDWDKILVEMTATEMGEYALGNADQQFQQVLQQVPQNMNQVPPMPMPGAQQMPPQGMPGAMPMQQPMQPQMGMPPQGGIQ